MSKEFKCIRMYIYSHIFRWECSTIFQRSLVWPLTLWRIPNLQANPSCSTVWGQHASPPRQSRVFSMGFARKSHRRMQYQILPNMLQFGSFWVTQSHLYLIAKILHYRAWCMYEHSKRLDWLRTRWRRIYSIKGILSCCESQCNFSHLNAYNLWDPICMMPSSHWMLVLGPHLVDSSSSAFATHDAVNEFFQSDLRTRTEADDGGNGAMTNDVNQRPKPRYSTQTQKLPKNLMNWITLSCTWLCIWHCRNALWKRCNKNMQHDSWFQTTTQWSLAS